MTAVVSTRCRNCHAELTDRFSRMLGYGPECRKHMTPDQLADAIRNQPGYIPKAKPVTAQARHNYAAAQAAVAPVEQADLCACGSGAVTGRCPPCNRLQRDPMGALADGVRRVIEQVRVERRAVRDAAYEAWQAARTPEPEQLTIGA